MIVSTMDNMAASYPLVTYSPNGFLDSTSTGDALDASNALAAAPVPVQSNLNEPLDRPFSVNPNPIYQNWALL